MTQALLIHAIIAFSALLPGVLMQFVNVESPNRWVGYRTPFSMKTQHTWEFANQFSAKAILWAGIITVAIQIVLYFVISSLEAQILITSGVMTLGFLMVIAITESKLHNRFDKDGMPKDLDADRF
ncbi:SdpI family protein [Roseivirga thermotolerans]|uniref:SdpI family protein n=1 Tax=Roseivirga thermotolerans TaxID=1758176 RepID=A0ABQ3I9S4_9BACT|nr:SdpI family protein [Roseivirga thermotolerans]GHE68191.1 hypothetical protein GCM10011340_24890 [Roseivirga thermotolerans]